MSDPMLPAPASSPSNGRRNRGNTIVWALILISAGVWFLLDNLGVNLPNIGQMWPIFVLAPGLLFLAGYAFGDDHDPGLAFVGTAATLLGVFFFLTTLGVGGLEPSDMGRLWPIYPLIGGIAFVVLWIAGGLHDWGVLIPAGIGLIIGVFGLGAVIFDRTYPFMQTLLKCWPAIFILIGLGLLAGYFANRRPE